MHGAIIRSLAFILILILITATLAIALLSGLTAWYDRPALVADTKVDGAQLLDTKYNPISLELDPLRAAPSVVEATAQSANLALVRPTGALRVSIVNTFDMGAERNPVSLGMGIIDGRSGALLAYTKLEADESQCAFSDLPTGSHWLVLCESKRNARFSYCNRIRIQIDADSRCELEIPTEFYSLTLTLAHSGDGDPPTDKIFVVIGRPDDPSWQKSYTPHARPDPKGIQVTVDGLGPGNYTLHIPGFTMPDNKQVDVQGPTTLELNGFWRNPL